MNQITQKHNIAIIYDVVGWAFWNKSIALEKYLSPFYNIELLPKNTVLDKKYDAIILHSPAVKYGNPEILPNTICGVSSFTARIADLNNYKYAFSNNTALYDKLPHQNKFYCPNGIDLDKFKHINKNFRSLNKKNPTKIGIISSKSRVVHKGSNRIKSIVRSLRLMGYNIVDVSLIVNPRDPNELYTFNKMLSYYRELDILIISSESETGPNTLLECMAVGIPVVTNRVGLVDELVNHKINGMIIDGYNNINGYVNAIKNIINDKELYKCIIDTAKSDISKFDWVTLVENYKKMIDHVIDKNYER